MVIESYFTFISYIMFKRLLIKIPVTECINGTYGYDCVNKCSGHCLNDSPCNKQTGYCDRGCNQGYINAYCSKGNPYAYILLNMNMTL